jgi:hypothetical protein
VPYLVGSRRAKADLRLRRVHAEPRAAPAELPHEVVPGPGTRPTLCRTAAPRWRACRVGTCRCSSAVTISLIARTSGGVNRWGDVRGTGRLLVKRTRVLQPVPSMESTGRQSQNRRSVPNGTNGRARSTPLTILVLGASVGQTLMRQREFRAPKQGHREPEQRRELLDASLQLQDLPSELRLCQIRHIQRDDQRPGSWRSGRYS